MTRLVLTASLVAWNAFLGWDLSQQEWGWAAFDAGMVLVGLVLLAKDDQ